MSWETKILCKQAIELDLDMDPGSSTFKHHVPSSKLLKVQIILSICYSVWGFSQWENSCQHLTVPGIKKALLWQLIFSPNSATISGQVILPELPPQTHPLPALKSDSYALDGLGWELTQHMSSLKGPLSHSSSHSSSSSAWSRMFVSITPSYCTSVSLPSHP